MFAALEQAQEKNGDYGISGGVTMLASQHRACVVDIGQARWVDVDTPEKAALIGAAVAAVRVQGPQDFFIDPDSQPS